MNKIVACFLFLLCYRVYSQNAPCEKKFVSPYNTYYGTVLYPNCSDSSVGFVRTYQGGKLCKEEWFRGNKPDGISRFYNWLDSANFSISETFSREGKALQFTSYFPNSNRTKFLSQATSDSTSFDIEYYDNGHLKAYGSKKGNCPYGEWTEYDSLGNYKWKGFYKFVSKSQELRGVIPETGEEFTTVLYTCAEKDGIWKKTDGNGRITETVLYVDGAIRKEK